MKRVGGNGFKLFELDKVVSGFSFYCYGVVKATMMVCNHCLFIFIFLNCYETLGCLFRGRLIYVLAHFDIYM